MNDRYQQPQDRYQQQQQPQPQARGVTRYPQDSLDRLMSEVAGNAVDSADVQRRLKIARELGQFVGPVFTGAPEIGHAWNFVVVPVDRVDDVFPVAGGGDDDSGGGQRGGSREPADYDSVAVKGHILSKVVGSYGAQWETKRLDNGHDPRFVWYEVTARYMGPSGKTTEMTCNHQMDLRDGSDQAKGMTEKALPRKRRDIIKLCETGARLRVIRAIFGIHGGRRDQIKPLVFMTRVWTGRSADPDEQTMLHGVTKMKLLLSEASLYGAEGLRLVAAVLNGGGGGQSAALPQGPVHAAIEARPVDSRRSPSGAPESYQDPDDDTAYEGDEEPTSAPPGQGRGHAAPPIPPPAPTPQQGAPRPVSSEPRTRAPWGDSDGDPPRWHKGQLYSEIHPDNLLILRDQFARNRNQAYAVQNAANIAGIDAAIAARQDSAHRRA